MNIRSAILSFLFLSLPLPSLIATEAEWAPDYFIVGAQKSGTTVMEQFIDNHPTISNKWGEIHFFDLKFDKGVEWYKQQFLPRPEPHFLIGDKSPYYLFHPLVPQRIAKLYPKSKIIIVLRNPVDRAYSQYWMNKGYLKFENLSFEDAIEAESNRLKGEKEKIINNPSYNSFEYQNHSYIARGIYVEQIKRWFEFFPRDQILIVDSNHLRNDTQKTMDKIFAFLGVPSYVPKENYKNEKSNYEPMNAATREKLIKFYQPYNEQLEALLGTKFDWK